MLGIYLTGHPLEEYEEEILALSTINSLEINQNNENIDRLDGTIQVVAGIVNDVRVMTTKRNNQMAFLQVQDLYSMIDIIIFPNVYEKFRDKIQIGNKIFIEGTLQTEHNNKVSIIAQNINKMEEIVKNIWISFKDKVEYKESNIKSIISEYEGQALVNIWLKDLNLKKTLEERVDFNKVYEKLVDKFGKDRVKITYKLMRG